jgi:hypothetical protein
MSGRSSKPAIVRTETRERGREERREGKGERAWDVHRRNMCII